MDKYSVSPSGEKFPCRKERLRSRVCAIESLVKAARAEGKEIVVVMGVVLWVP